MSDDTPSVPVFCPDCETTTRVAIDDVAEAIERHNEQLHDGEDVASVDPDVAEQLADIVVEDLGLLEEE